MILRRLIRRSGAFCLHPRCMATPALALETDMSSLERNHLAPPCARPDIALPLKRIHDWMNAEADDREELPMYLRELMLQNLEHLVSTVTELEARLSAYGKPRILSTSLQGALETLHGGKGIGIWTNRVRDIDAVIHAALCPHRMLSEDGFGECCPVGTMQRILDDDESAVDLVEDAYGTALRTHLLAQHHSHVCSSKSESESDVRARTRTRAVVGQLDIVRVMHECASRIVDIDRDSLAAGSSLPEIKIRALPSIQEDTDGYLAKSDWISPLVQIDKVVRGILEACISRAIHATVTSASASTTDSAGATHPKTVTVSVADGRTIGGQVCVRIDDYAGGIGGWRASRNTRQASWLNACSCDSKPSVADVLPVHGVATARVAARIVGGDVDEVVVDGVGRSLLVRL